MDTGGSVVPAMRMSLHRWSSSVGCLTESNSSWNPCCWWLRTAVQQYAVWLALLLLFVSLFWLRVLNPPLTHTHNSTISPWPLRAWERKGEELVFKARCYFQLRHLQSMNTEEQMPLWFKARVINQQACCMCITHIKKKKKYKEKQQGNNQLWAPSSSLSMQDSLVMNVVVWVTAF